MGFVVAMILPHGSEQICDTFERYSAAGYPAERHATMISSVRGMACTTDTRLVERLPSLECSWDKSPQEWRAIYQSYMEICEDVQGGDV